MKRTLSKINCRKLTFVASFVCPAIYIEPGLNDGCRWTFPSSWSAGSFRRRYQGPLRRQKMQERYLQILHRVGTDCVLSQPSWFVCRSVSQCLCVGQSVMVCVQVSQSVFVCTSVSQCLCVRQSVMVCVYVSQSVFVCRSVSHGLCAGQSVCVCV